MSIEALIDVQQGGEGRVGLFLSTRVVPSTKAPDDVGIRLYWVPAEMFIRKMRHMTLLSSRQEITVISLVVLLIPLSFPIRNALDCWFVVQM